MKQYVLRANSSMKWPMTVRLIGVIAIVILLIAIAFTSLGLWLVVPFLGLELILIISAFILFHVRTKRMKQ